MEQGAMRNERVGAIVGAFVVGGALLFAVGLFLIGDRRLLFAEHYEIETTFRNVAGLRAGTKVRVAGMDAGEIVGIGIPREPSEPFAVRLRVRSDLQRLVRTDSVAGIETDGLVGASFVQIRPGSDAAPVAPPGSRIRGVDPIGFADVMAQASDTLRLFQGVVKDVSGHVGDTLAELAETTKAVNEVVGRVDTAIGELSAAGEGAVAEFRGVLAETRGAIASVRRGEGTLGKLVADDALYEEVRAVASRTAATAESLREASEATRAGVERLLAPAGPVDAVLRELRDSADAAGEVLADLAENTEALKRNWLFRGFFRRRGFFDLDAMTPQQYRRFAADASRRQVLRVWVEAAVLFARDERGVERLTEEGQRRLDLAMGTFLEYRRDSPLVVEGYASEGPASQQFLASDTRARAVRDYLVRRFRRDASLTGSIGLAADASDAPQGTGRWDGVALALHVER
jgi:phospholipid/cholesterol/gamma-HCH transport system substrate-binding protein